MEQLRLLFLQKRCQTVAYIVDPQQLLTLAGSGVKGVDRIVPIGKTMNFDFIWDGYDLAAQLTRVIKLYK